MKDLLHEILEKYWGYKQFRPLQEDIMRSVLNGKDTLALLPTGGGKSLCFQVPAMAKEGVCIVVSPLIALMKDQVENLQKRGIKAAAAFSGMKQREISLAYDNCIYGKHKFLYISPERLETTFFREKAQQMPVSLIAVDEAHCISQWGYDFRPSYINIAQFRNLFPQVPVLALTATATPAVVEDIQEKLLFKEKHVLQKSFARSNLAYMVLFEEDKRKRLVKICRNVAGSGVVYLRSRKRTEEIADFLNKQGISADFYHAGLENHIRSEKQEAWISGKKRVIVATNAFGMGIDKPDVRFVVHIDLPDSLEAYFQEAGRGGRDEKKAYAVLLFEKADKITLIERTKTAFPSIDEIRNIYDALFIYLGIALHHGRGLSLPFDFSAFCRRYSFQAATVKYALQFLEREGFLTYSDAVFLPSRVHITVNKEELYKFQVAYPAYDFFIKTMLRLYGGLFSGFVPVNEYELSRRLKKSLNEVKITLQYFQKCELLTYEEQTDLPVITLLFDRLAKKFVKISKENYQFRKEAVYKRAAAVIQYVEKNDCRSRMLLAYFGEKVNTRCGTCDDCIEKNKYELSEEEFEKYRADILSIIRINRLSVPELAHKMENYKEIKVAKVIQWMLEHDELKYDTSMCLYVVGE